MLQCKMQNFLLTVYQIRNTIIRIILTNGFVKKTMKTPKAELDLARKYEADYEMRQKP